MPSPLDRPHAPTLAQLLLEYGALVMQGREHDAEKQAAWLASRGVRVASPAAPPPEPRIEPAEPTLAEMESAWAVLEPVLYELMPYAPRVEALREPWAGTVYEMLYAAGVVRFGGPLEPEDVKRRLTDIWGAGSPQTPEPGR